MSNARPVVQDSMELAKRINDSTDIVTDLTDVVQNELPQKALQGDNPEATNSEILRAIDNIDIDTSELAKEETLIQGVSSIRSDIANIDIDTSELAKEETLVQGVSGIRSDIANIPAPDLSEVAKQGDNPEATNSEILRAIDNVDIDLTPIEEKLNNIGTKLDTLNGYFDDVTYENVIEELNSSEDDA